MLVLALDQELGVNDKYVIFGSEVKVSFLQAIKKKEIKVMKSNKRIFLFCFQIYITTLILQS